MMKGKLRPLVLFVCLSSTSYFALPLGAQIVTMYGEPGAPDSYMCVQSGLKGMGSDCGTENNEMVFTAVILSIKPAPDNEALLTLRPNVVFKGTPTEGMQIRTSQSRCLPAMNVGDSWLFSLFRDEKSKELIVGFGSRSGPESKERQQIHLLQRLASLDTAGVVKGRAYSYQLTEDNVRETCPSLNHRITLTRVEDGKKLIALTDKDGEFEFKPLPAGKYNLDPNTRPGLWTNWSGEIEVKPHGCTDFDLDFQVDGRIAGRLVFPDGVDPSEWEIEATPVDDPEVVPASAWTDKAGQFVLHGLSPGKYIVVIESTDNERDGPNLSVDLFAPGTPNRANAQIIEIGKAMVAEGIELIVPAWTIK